MLDKRSKGVDLILSQELSILFIGAAKCAHVAFQSMLIKPTVVSAGGGATPNAALYAAVLTRGGPPELPGFEAGMTPI